MNKIFFNKSELDICLDFANKVKSKHPHFKDKNNNATRTEQEIINDVVRGKIAELGLYKYLVNKHKNEDFTISEVDFNIYPKFIGDSYDLVFNDIVISIKSSKPYSSCLLIEEERFICNDKGDVIAVDSLNNKLPDYYVFIRINVDINNYKNTYAEICGAISHIDFMKYKKVAPRGMILNKANIYDFFINNKPANFTGKGIPLLATNYGVHLKNLNKF